MEASPWLEDNQWVLDVAAKDTIVVGTVGDLEPGTFLRVDSSGDAWAESEMDGTRLVLCHYPFKSWNGMRKNSGEARA